MLLKDAGTVADLGRKTDLPQTLLAAAVAAAESVVDLSHWTAADLGADVLSWRTAVAAAERIVGLCR